MTLDTYPMRPAVRKQSKRLLEQIQSSDSMIQCVKCGARAEGFVLGMSTLEAIPADTWRNWRSFSARPPTTDWWN